jgi:hypothetical protein
MQLGETIATYDVAVALRGESGKFEVTSPAGNTFRVTCKINHSIANLEWSGEGSDARPFLIRKVAEIVSQVKTTGEIAHETEPNRAAPVPFLLEQHEAAEKLRTEDDLLMMEVEHREVQPHASGLDLYYVDCDPATGQPAWGVCLKGETGSVITPLCATFNDLDTEIRSLHAQLDEIRSRARKNFYKAQTMAASA